MTLKKISIYKCTRKMLVKLCCPRLFVSLFENLKRPQRQFSEEPISIWRKGEGRESYDRNIPYNGDIHPHSIILSYFIIKTFCPLFDTHSFISKNICITLLLIFYFLEFKYIFLLFLLTMLKHRGTAKDSLGLCQCPYGKIMFIDKSMGTHCNFTFNMLYWGLPLWETDLKNNQNICL